MNGRSTVTAITDRIREANDIVDVIGSYVSLSRAGREFRALCPFHSEKTPSFYVVPSKQIFKCFGCGAGGDVFTFVHLKERVEFRDARAILAERAGIDLSVEERRGSAAGPGKLDLERANRWAMQWFQEQFRGVEGGPARAYAAGRGLTPESIERFSIGYAPADAERILAAARRRDVPLNLLIEAGVVKKSPDGGRPYGAFADRLILPIRDAMDRVIGFGGRALGEDRIKYLNTSQTPLFDKGRCLYGISLAKSAFAAKRCAVVVEGYLDCIVAHQFGVDHAVATLGTALTPEHVETLRRYVDAVVLVFDSDEAGQRAADRSLEVFLRGQLEVRIAKVPKGKDPADYLISEGKEAFEGVLTSAVPALGFKWNQLLGRYHGGASGPDRRRAVEEFLGLLSEATEAVNADPIQKGLVVNQVGKLLGLPAEEVYEQLRLLSRRRRPARSAPAESAPLGGEGFEGRAARDGATAAMQQMIEVVLNEPARYESIAAWFDPRLLEDEDLRAIGAALEDWAATGSTATLPGLMERFESARLAARITELQIRGDRRGNFAGTLEGAIAAIQRSRMIEEARRHTQDLRSTGGMNVTPEAAEEDGTTALRRELTAVARQINGFAAQRHLAASRARPPGTTVSS